MDLLAIISRLIYIICLIPRVELILFRFPLPEPEEDAYLDFLMQECIRARWKIPAEMVLIMTPLFLLLLFQLLSLLQIAG